MDQPHDFQRDQGNTEEVTQEVSIVQPAALARQCADEKPVAFRIVVIDPDVQLIVGDVQAEIEMRIHVDERGDIEIFWNPLPEFFPL